MGRQNPITVTQLKLHFIQHIPHRLYFLCVMHNQTPFKIFPCVLWVYAVRVFFMYEWRCVSLHQQRWSRPATFTLWSPKLCSLSAYFTNTNQRELFFQLYLSFSIPLLHLIQFLTHPSPHLTPTSPPPPIFSVAQQPSVINELLQFDLIYLRIGHVW